MMRYAGDDTATTVRGFASVTESVYYVQANQVTALRDYRRVTKRLDAR
jgi:hypothetical protein